MARSKMQGGPEVAHKVARALIAADVARRSGAGRHGLWCDS